MSDDGAYSNTPSKVSARPNRLRSSVIDIALGRRSPISSNSRNGEGGGDIGEDGRVDKLLSRLKAAEEELNFHSQHERSYRDDVPDVSYYPAPPRKATSGELERNET